jgi:hypothetical protein
LARELGQSERFRTSNPRAPPHPSPSTTLIVSLRVKLFWEKRFWASHTPCNRRATTWCLPGRAATAPGMRFGAEESKWHRGA